MFCKKKEKKIEHGFGMLPSPKDMRDYRIAAAAPVGEMEFESEYVVPYTIHPQLDQNGSNMCVAYSFAYMMEMFNRKEYNNNINLSRAFIYCDRNPDDGYYYNDREGMFPRGALNQLILNGTCKAETWDMLVRDWKTSALEITDAMREEAKKYKIASYARSFTIAEMKTALKTYGAMMISVPITWKFLGDYQDIMDSAFIEANYYALHAVVCVGWTQKDGIEYWICKNSWGENWGLYGGKFYYPTQNLVTEAWSVVDWIEPKEIEKPKYWRVQVGAWNGINAKEMAQAYQLNFTNMGRPTYIVNVNGWTKVQLGAWFSKSLAEAYRDEIIVLGFPAFLVYY